jgi:hypothetical protein
MRIAVTRVFSYIAVLCVTFGSTGCSSGPKAIPYSFAEGYSETATVTFETDNKYSVSFRTFEGEKLPEPAPGTVWDTAIIFPAGIPLITLVHVYYDGRDHFFWTGAVFSGVSSPSTGGGAIGLLLLLGFTLGRDILWSPVVFVDMATADSQKTNRDVIFVMPALENGRKYKVWFKRRGKKYTLYLTDMGSGRVVYEQEFDRVEEKWNGE